MKLEYVDVKNFRSVREIRIDFSHSCRVLVGINESGKSNILNALAFLNDNYKPVRKNDLREKLPGEAQIKKSGIRFIFKFEKNESDELISSVSSKILARVKNPDIVSVQDEILKIKEFCTHGNLNEGLYEIDILEEIKFPQFWSLPDNYELLPGWKKPTNLCPSDFSIELDGQNYKLANYALIRVEGLPSISDEYLEDAEINDLKRVYGQTIREITKKHLPKALFWEYDENNFLPESIGIVEFSQNPDSCIPLRNMFTLAKIENIKESIDLAYEGSRNQFQNYLDNIAKQTTEHFRNVWKEYRTIEFSLKANGDQIIPGIKEKNTYDFAWRSDGFKRFVTFLLMISVNVKTDRIRNTLLLVDEPEISLHPSGARYLRDELINISKKNRVVYSTHSIFMVDSGSINRHYIVKKENEVTDIASAEDSNIADEEVLYNALGHSVFSILKEKNLIFEGWRDKHLFWVALENSNSALKQKYKNVGVCHAKGVKSIKAITPMIELAGRSCLILSDGDKEAKEQKREYKKIRGFGDWKTYQDVDSSIQAVTGEDFIQNDFIAQQVNTVLSNNETLPFNGTDLPGKKDKLSAIRRWLKKNAQMTGDQAEETIREIKRSIFDNLRHENIEHGEYLKLLEGISFP